MILDGRTALALIIQWKSSGDNHILEKFLKLCDPLIHITVLRYSWEYRDDLSQECRLALLRVLEKFDESKSPNAYGYITTAINNACRSYISKYGSYAYVESIREDQHMMTFPDTIPADLLENLIIRNRDRFPSLSSVIDEMTEMIYYRLLDSTRKLLVKDLMESYDVSRNEATVVVHSSLVHLRSVLRNHVAYGTDTGSATHEFTLLPEFEGIVGSDIFQRISTIFSGMYIKFPSL